MYIFATICSFCAALTFFVMGISFFFALIALVKQKKKTLAAQEDYYDVLTCRLDFSRPPHKDNL